MVHAIGVFTTALFSLTVYFLIGYTLEEVLKDEVRLSMDQIAAQVENEDDTLFYENEVPVSAGTMYFITEESGSELFSHGADITLLDYIPVEADTFRFATRAGQKWLLLDSDVLTVEPFRVRIRVAASCAANERVLSILRLILLLALPVLILAALVGGRLIAGRALARIRHVVESAENISPATTCPRAFRPPRPRMSWAK